MSLLRSEGLRMFARHSDCQLVTAWVSRRAWRRSLPLRIQVLVQASVGCDQGGSAMEFEHILVERSGEFATVTMNRPERRNALSLAHMRELIRALHDIGDSDALGIVLAGAGPVFSAGHDFADVAEADFPAVRSLLVTCTELMTLIQQVPQPVVARVHGLATAAGCQLVAAADLAVASENAGFAAPGGPGGPVPHPPVGAAAQNMRRKPG